MNINLKPYIFICICTLLNEICVSECYYIDRNNMTVPTVTIGELSAAIEDKKTNAPSKKILTSILNDFMNLVYGIETPYTTGKQIMPTDVTLSDLDSAIQEKSTVDKFRKIFEKIVETEKKGDYTPQSDALNDHIWDPKFKPVLVFVTPNKNEPLPKKN